MTMILKLGWAHESYARWLIIRIKIYCTKANGGGIGVGIQIFQKEDVLYSIETLLFYMKVTFLTAKEMVNLES